jgi:hypothetical protein
VETHVTEFRFTEAEVAESECEMLAVRVQLREDQVALPSGVKSLTTGSKSIAPVF